MPSTIKLLKTINVSETKAAGVARLVVEQGRAQKNIADELNQERAE